MDKGKISWIYLHGLEIEEKNEKGLWVRHWLCKQCLQKKGIFKAMANASTSSCGTHLKTQHSIYPLGRQPPAAPLTESVLDHYLEEQHPLHAERWRTSFINWVTAEDISFEEASSEHLKQMVIHGGPTVKDLLPSRHTVRAWVIDTYKERLPEVKASLHSSNTQIVLSLDGWSALNNLELLGVVGHWLNEKHELKTALLGLRPLEGHTGADIADVLEEVIDTYDIAHKIAGFQMDNASNNDTALNELAKRMPINKARTRLRCFGHIVNLVVKALLFGKGSSRFQSDLQAANDSESYALWRQRGAIGHLHNLVSYISRSPRRLRAFEAAQKVDAGPLVQTLHLVKDTGVRWNSTYYMIQRALRLQPALQKYCREWKPTTGETYDLKGDMLDPEDWEELRHFEELLQPFERATKRLEGNAYNGTHGALWEVIPTMDYLFIKLKKHADEVTENPHLFTDHYQACLDHGFFKLRDYFIKIDETPYYAAAVALHPYKRFTYFEDAWQNTVDSEASILAAKTTTRRLFDEYLKRACAESTSPPLARTTLFMSDDEDEDWRTAFGDHTKEKERARGTRRKQETELERFMEDTHDTYFTEISQGKTLTRSYLEEPLRWWRDVGQAAYPTLAIMAFDLFTMPGMSSECERVFSSAKSMLTDHRYNLRYDIVEADQCVKSWFKNNVADGRAAFTNIAADDGDEVTEIDGI
jgi:hypothetical protein